jgi:hypothetical protein
VHIGNSSIENVAARGDKTSPQAIVLITIGHSCTTAYLNIHFAGVERLFASATLRTDVTCTKHSQVMPSQGMVKRVLNRKIVTMAVYLRTYMPCFAKHALASSEA